MSFAADIEIDCPPLLDLVAKSAGLVEPITIKTFVGRQLYVNKYLKLSLRAETCYFISITTLTYRHFFDFSTSVQHELDMLTFSAARIGEHGFAILGS